MTGYQAIEVTDSEERSIELYGQLGGYASGTKSSHEVLTSVHSTGDGLDVNDLRAEPRVTRWKPPPTNASLFSRLQARWVNGWIAEVLSCALSVVMLACLVSTLRYFDGRVVTRMPLRISINTLVAILTAIIKSSLLLPVAEGISQSKWIWFMKSRRLIEFDRFDQASRGPWGSLLLASHLKARNLAALGAWITVLAIAIDPFSQQIIRPIVCHRVLSGPEATVPRANNLSDVSQYVGGGMPRILEPNIAAELFASLLTDPGAIPVQCPTGNCTFTNDSTSGASYQTIAFESACVDVTDETKSAGDDNISTAWYIPSLGDRTLRASFQTPILTMSKFNGTYFPERWSGRPATESIISFATISLNRNESACNTSGDIAGSDCWTPFAAECRIWPAIRTIGSRIELSDLKETVLYSQPLHLQYNPERYQLEQNWLHVSSQILRNGSWERCSKSNEFTQSHPVAVHNSTLWRNDPNDGNASPEEISWYANDCVWSIDIGSASALRSFAMDTFHRQNVTSYGGGFNTAYGEIWIKALYQQAAANLSTVEDYTGRLARSLTMHTRLLNSRQSPDSGIVRGFALRTETCIQIRWVWISFPAGLLALGIVFLATTIYDAGRTGRPGVWKSSSLPVLFYSLNEQVPKQAGSSGLKSDMDACAKELQVSLQSGGQGWRFGQ